MHLEDALAANTAALIAQTNAIRELAALLAKGMTTPAPAPADAAPEAASGTGKKSGKAKGDTAPAKPVVTYPEVSAAITQLAKEKGRDAAISVLKDFGVKNAKELEAGKFEAFVEAVKAALAADDEELA